MHIVNNLSREEIKNPLARYYETCKHLISQAYNLLVDKNTHKKIMLIQQDLFEYLNALEYVYKDAHTIPHIIQDRTNTHPLIWESGLRSSKHLIEKNIVASLPAHQRTSYKNDIHFALEPFTLSIELDLDEIKELMQKGNMLWKAAFDHTDDTLALQNDMIFIERDEIVYKLKKERIYDFGVSDETKQLSFLHLQKEWIYNDLVSKVHCDLLYLIKEYPHTTKNIYDSFHTRPVVGRWEIKDLYTQHWSTKLLLDR